MKRFTWVLLTALLSAIHAQAETVPLSSIKRVTTLPTVSNKFIVELDSLSDIPSKRDVSPHANLYESLKKRDVGFEVNKEFNSAGLFVGAALTLTDAKDVNALLNTPGVKAIRPVKKLARPAPVKKVVVKDRSDPAVPADTQSTHVLTGVDKLHAQGIIGTGVKIGIIDTGIDYNHPALGAGFGPGHKVIGGYDLVGDDYTGDNTPVPDPDPLDQCEGHGTHVAGIIGANPGNPFDISGVAYGASISAYRVFGCAGQVTDDVIVEALLLGVKEGQDILTLSLGGADGWTESSSSVVASRIAASGKIVTIAAGNDGDSGSWYTSSPGNGVDVISVASLDNTVIALQNATLGGVEHPPITYFSALPLPITSTLPIYATSNDTTVVDDACNPLPDSTPDLSSKLVLIRRGSCTFVQKLTNAADKGAKYALIYDNGSGFAGISVGDFVATLIQAADGEYLVSQLAAGVPVTISFPQSGASTQYPDPNGGLISSFTSYGPSNDFYFKPSVAAPGGNILSTLPLPLGAYGVESGTSMATPFVAGSAALVLSVKGKSPPVGKSIRSLFESTAKQVPSSKTDGDPLQTLTQQGAGLINVYDAIQATTVISPTQLVLNDTAHFHPLQTFTIKNTGKSAKTYRLSHVPAGTAETVKPDSILPAIGPVPLTTAAVSVTIFPKTVTISPGSSQIVTAVFQLPSGDASTFPVYSGFIQVSGSSASDSFHVSYLGLGAALKDKQVVDNSDFYFGIPTPAVLDSIGDIQSDPSNYTFVGGDWPSLVFRLAFGTPTLRIDLVDPNIKLVGTLNTRQERQGGPIFTFPKKHPGGSFAQVKVLGSLTEFNWIPRNDESVPPGNGYNLFSLNTPTFANGSTISNGSYRFLLRALKVTGNPDSEADYESWLSPVVGVTPV